MSGFECSTFLSFFYYYWFYHHYCYHGCCSQRRSLSFIACYKHKLALARFLGEPNTTIGFEGKNNRPAYI